MADTKLTIFQSDGTTAAIDYRTEATNGDGRQVITIGDPSLNNNVAVVQQVDPASNTQGLVVRDVNTSAVAGFLAGTLGVYLNSTAGTVNVALKPGTIAVQLDPGHELGSIRGITNSINTYIGGTAGTLGVRVGQIDGSVAVYFSPANPAVNATFSATTLAVVPITGSGHAMYDETLNAAKVTLASLIAGEDLTNNVLNVQIAGSNSKASLQITGITNTVGVYLDSTQGTVNVALKPGTMAVQLDPGHTLGNIGTIGSITGSVAVYFDRANPSVSATFSAASIEVIPTTGSRKTTDDASASQRVLIVGSQTNASLTINGSITGITNTIAVDNVTATGGQTMDENYKAQRVLVVGSQSNASLAVSGTVTANAGTGSMTVQLDPGHELGTIRGNSNTLTVFLPDTGHTLGNIGTIGSITGSVAVYFDRGNPSVNATFTASSLEVVPTTGSRKITDDASAAMRVLVVGSQTNASLTINGTITGITNTIAVDNVTASGGQTMDENYKAQRVLIVGSSTNSSLTVSGTVTSNAGTGSLTVQFDPGHELGNIRGNSNTLTVFLPDTGHTLGKVDAGTGTFQVYLPDTGHEIGTIRGNTNTLTVFLPDTGHTLGFIQGTKTSLAVTLDPGSTLGKVDQGVASTTQAWLVNSQSTASIFTASGTANGISVSGNTIISPSANASFKIYAFSVQTTGQVSLATKFTNGSGGSPTEFFRPLITASGVTGAQGANLSTGGPGNPLFVTGTSTTLALVLDSATLVHYSVSYTKESA